jgi:hypothetical protein
MQIAQYVIIYGDERDGFITVGPFKSLEDAQSYETETGDFTISLLCKPCKTLKTERDAQ